MKRLLGFFLICLLANRVVALPPEEYNNKLGIAHGLKLAPQSLKESNRDLKYKINLKFPQFSGNHMDAAASHFNQEISQQVNTKAAAFKTKVVGSAAATRALPKAVQQNQFDLVYAANAFKAANAILLSIRFEREYFFAGAAHGEHNIEVYNYDLSSGERLKLEDLFNSGSDYLQILSAYCRKNLPAKIENSDSKWISSGTEPRAENFTNWNLRPDGILITFDEYQVAAYVDGQPEVLIPYKALEKVISPNAAIAVCVKNSAACPSLQ